MPSSYHGFISLVLEKVLDFRPRSVLDVGMGFGKWGFLFREYLDAFWGRSAPSEWLARIDGIEAHAPYLTGHHRVYSHIHNGNALHVLPLLGDYDFIFAGDVLEHLQKDDGRKLLATIRAKSKLAILSVPLGNLWPQGPVSGNLYECHRAVWDEQDFGDAQEVIVHQFTGRPIAMVTYQAIAASRAAMGPISAISRENQHPNSQMRDQQIPFNANLPVPSPGPHSWGERRDHDDQAGGL